MRALEGEEIVPSTSLRPKDPVSQHATPPGLWVPAASELGPIRAGDGSSGQMWGTVLVIARSGCDFEKSSQVEK